MMQKGRQVAVVPSLQVGVLKLISWFLGLPHTLQALIATLFTWGVTALGAALVFFFRSMNKNALDAMLRRG